MNKLIGVLMMMPLIVVMLVPFVQWLVTSDFFAILVVFLGVLILILFAVGFSMFFER